MTAASTARTSLNQQVFVQTTGQKKIRKKSNGNHQKKAAPAIMEASVETTTICLYQILKGY
jgi:hypothetical protein